MSARLRSNLFHDHGASTKEEMASQSDFRESILSDRRPSTQYSVWVWTTIESAGNCNDGGRLYIQPMRLLSALAWTDSEPMNCGTVISRVVTDVSRNIWAD
jgi:hypothetical protein